MKLPPSCLVFSLVIASTVLAIAQQTKSATPQARKRLTSPEVHADNTVTFRFLAPNAQEVKLDREGAEPVSHA